MVRTPGSVAAQILLALGADLDMIELAVAAGHVPSLPEADVVLPVEFRKLLVHQASLTWPRPRLHFASTTLSVLWYLATLAIMVTASLGTVGPELVVGLAAAGLLGLALLHVLRVRRAAVAVPADSSQVQSPPELTALVARWGISDFAICLRDDYRLDDHAVRIGAKARIGVSREVFNRPSESGFVIAHELAHLLRNDSTRGLIDRWLRLSLVLPALITFTPWIWALTAASLLLHTVAKNWATELGSDRIAVMLHGHEQMMSFAQRTHTSKHWPALTHPALRVANLAREKDNRPPRLIRHGGIGVTPRGPGFLVEPGQTRARQRSTPQQPRPRKTSAHRFLSGSVGPVARRVAVRLAVRWSPSASEISYPLIFVVVDRKGLIWLPGLRPS